MNFDDRDGTAMESCRLLTAQASEAVRPLHERMPAILGPADFGAWLDPSSQESGGVLPLLLPCAGELAAVPVGRYFSNTQNEGPRCLAGNRRREWQPGC